MLVSITETDPKLIDMSKMEIGQVGILMTDVHYPQRYNGAVILRTYEGFIDLRDPSCTWRSMGVGVYMVKLLPKGTKITLTL